MREGARERETEGGSDSDRKRTRGRKKTQPSITVYFTELHVSELF